MAGVIVGLAACSTTRPIDTTGEVGRGAQGVVHPNGILDPNDPEFHGALVQRLGYDLGLCAKCHGEDFAGGAARVSCLTCHEDPGGPTACTTCHGQPPSTGAHLEHEERGIACTECHVVPTVYTDAGHLSSPAKVTFGPRAQTNGAEPAFSDGRCAGVYCHGSATPLWTGGPAEAACGTCHTIPPASHENPRCVECHARVIDASGAIIDQTLHVDGLVSLGDDRGTCGSCHPKLSGAHDAHTQAPHRLRGPLGCSECHFVPTAVDSPGHIDHPDPEVFPAGTSALARTGGKTPSFDPQSGRCSGVYCHGERTPSWSDTTTAEASCGSCHGVPPADAAHASAGDLGGCYLCHPRTIDPTGALISAGPHIDGVVDAP